MLKKRNVYLVPHTHWDREWYFTKDTGDVLLNHMINDIVNHAVDSPMMLDGQFSLVDDYLKDNPGDRAKISELLKKGIISSGPFYTQPDVFNSSGETTLRNIEMGIKVGNDLGFKQLKTAYLPDTFGFNQNLPQIFKHKGLENFIFWRGPSQELLDKTFYFKWQGVDGSSVNAYNFRRGYFSLGPNYPYNGKQSGKKYDIDRMLKKFTEVVDEVKVDKGPIILPLGGDQAPYLHEARELIGKMNDKSKKYNFQVVSNYDVFFNEQETPDHIVQGDLKIPLTGKIHRTISSSRYDIKRAFRDAENKLYHLLEPLEVFYSALDKEYNFETFKNNNIIKPLLVAQAHDSLGGCNTDITNKGALDRLLRIEDFTMAQVDLLIKKIIHHKKVKDEHLVIFNPAPFETNIFERKTIYSDTNKDIYIKENDFSIYTLSSKNIAIKKDKKVYEQDVIIYSNKLKPLSFNDLDISKSEDKKVFGTKTHNSIFKITGNNILVNGKNIKFTAIEDLGDGYDFSPGKKLSLKQTHKIIKSIEIADYVYFYEVESILKIADVETKVKWNIFVEEKNNKIRTNFEIFNKFVNTRLSINIEKKKTDEVKKSQHLAITPFFENDYIDNWKERGYTEYPAHVDQNDALITINDFNIMTKGTNEIFKDDDFLKIVLYRTNDLVTKGNMKWRPTTSGLSFEWNSEDAKLLKKIELDLEFNMNDNTTAINEWMYKPYSYKVQNGNFIANKMSKFVINNILAPQSIEVDIKVSKNIYISSFRKIDNELVLRVANLINEENEFIYEINGKKNIELLKPYKIREITIKGVYDGK